MSPCIALLTSLVILASIVVYVSAQKAVCLSDPDHRWGYNARDQSPCDVAGRLLSECTGLTVVITPLDPDHIYSGSVASGEGNLCRCSSVYYALISACAQCQGRNWATWDAQIAYCSSNISVMSLPISSPSKTTIPAWAYLDYPSVGNFDLGLARSVLTTSSSALSSSISTTSVVISTISTMQAITPTTSDPSTSTTSSEDKVPAGVFIGGLLGGISALAVILGLVACIFIRRKKKKINDDNDGTSTTSGSSSNSSVMSLRVEEPRTALGAISPSMLQVPAQDTRLIQPSLHVPHVNVAIPQNHETDPNTYTVTQDQQPEFSQQCPSISPSFGPRASRSSRKQGPPRFTLPHSPTSFLSRASIHFGPRARSCQQPEPSLTAPPGGLTETPADESTSTQYRPASHSLQPLRPQTLSRPFQPLRASHVAES